jgi:hypothetical protein
MNAARPYKTLVQKPHRNRWEENIKVCLKGNYWLDVKWRELDEHRAVWRILWDRCVCMFHINRQLPELSNTY